MYPYFVKYDCLFILILKFDKIFLIFKINLKNHFIFFEDASMRKFDKYEFIFSEICLFFFNSGFFFWEIFLGKFKFISELHNNLFFKKTLFLKKSRAPLKIWIIPWLKRHCGYKKYRLAKMVFNPNCLNSQTLFEGQ